MFVMVVGWKDVTLCNGNLVPAEITLIYPWPRCRRSWRMYFVECGTIDLPNTLCVLVEGHDSFSVLQRQDLRAWPDGRTTRK